MRVAIHQPNFLPWIGYFHKIALVDEFVFLDDVQLPLGKSFCSRVKILGMNGPMWLTVPVQKSTDVLIKDAKIADDRWKNKHLRTIELTYRKTPFFSDYWPHLAPLIEGASDRLAELNISLIERIAQVIGLPVRFYRSSLLDLETIANDTRILHILNKLKAHTYVTGEGQGSQRYVHQDDFLKHGINLEMQGFVHPVYTQQSTSFEQYMSIIDFLFNAGPDYFQEILLKRRNA